MNGNQTTDLSFWRRTLKKTWVRICCGLILLFAAFLILLPLGLRIGSERWLLNNGADQATIKKIKINIFTGEASLKGVNVILEDRTVLADSNIYLNLSLKSLLQHTALVQSATLEGVTLDVEQYEDGRLRIGSYTIHPGDSTEKEPEDTKDPWLLSLEQIEFSDCFISYTMPDFETSLHIQKAELIKLSTVPTEKSGTLTMQGLLDNAPLQLELDNLRLAPELEIGGRIMISDLQLDSFADLLKKYLAPFSGRTAAEGEFNFKLSHTNSVLADYEGNIELDDSDIGGPGFAAGGKGISWSGPASFRQDKNSGLALNLDGSLQASGLKLDLEEPEIHLQEETLDIKSKTAITIDRSLKVDSEGTIVLGNMDFSMPPYQVQNNNLSWQGDASYSSVDQNVRVDGTLALQNPSFIQTGKAPSINAGGNILDWQGTVEYGGAGQQASTIKLDGSLQASGLRLDMEQPEIHLQEETLEIKNGKATITLDPTLTITSESTIALAGTDFAMPPYQVQNNNFSWQGDAFYSAADQNVRVDGILSLQMPSFTQTGETSSISAGSSTLGWKGAVEYGGAGQKLPKTIDLKGELNGENMQATMTGPDLQFSQEALTFSGEATLPIEDIRQLQGNAQQMQLQGLQLAKNSSGQTVISLAGLSVDTLQAPGGSSLSVANISADQLDLFTPDPGTLQVSIPEITFAGLNTNDMESFSLQEIVLQSLLAKNTKKGDIIASIEEVSLADIRASMALDLSAAELSVKNTQIIPQKKLNSEEGHFIQFTDLSVTNPELSSSKNLHFTDINATDLQVNFIKGKDGKFLALQALNELQGGAAEETPQTAETETGKTPPVAETEPEMDKQQPLSFQISAITLKGNNSIRFEDHSLKLPFVMDLAVDNFQVTDVDSTNPEKIASFELKGMLDQYAPLSIRGTVTPVADNFSLYVTTSLKNYQMIRLAPYSIASLGFTPTQGTLTVDGHYSMKQGHIDLKKNLLLKKLELKTVDEELAQKFESQLPVSLDQAVSILKDKKDNIELTIPMSGPADDLDISIVGLIITPLSKAIITASSSYFLYTLGPYGAAAYVGLKLGEKMMETRLPAVEFKPGEKALTEDHIKYLERIAEILKNRPKLDMEICPHVLPAEHLAKKEEEQKKPPEELSDKDKKDLILLGHERAQAVKNYLVQDHDIDPSRLLICLAELDKNEGAVPRVELDI